MNDFIESLKSSPYYVGITNVPSEWGTEERQGYKGHHYTVGVVVKTNLEDGFVVPISKSSSKNEMFLDINLVDEILTPVQLIEQVEKTKKGFESFLEQNKTEVCFKKVYTVPSNIFKDGVWMTENETKTSSSYVKTLEEAHELLQKKEEGTELVFKTSLYNCVPQPWDKYGLTKEEYLKVLEK